MSHIPFVYNDGGRKAAGYKGEAGDCVCRAIVIASGRPYQEVYDRLATGMASNRRTKRTRVSSTRRSASNGITTTRKWFRDYMTELGFVWVPTMQIGSGCKVHLRPDELPSGRLVVAISKHYCAVIDGVLHDTSGGNRNGTRCVYGYWHKQDVSMKTKGPLDALRETDESHPECAPIHEVDMTPEDVLAALGDLSSLENHALVYEFERAFEEVGPSFIVIRVRP